MTGRTVALVGEPSCETNQSTANLRAENFSAPGSRLLVRRPAVAKGFGPDGDRATTAQAAPSEIRATARWRDTELALQRSADERLGRVAPSAFKDAHRTVVLSG